MLLCNFSKIKLLENSAAVGWYDWGIDSLYIFLSLKFIWDESGVEFLTQANV